MHAARTDFWSDSAGGGRKSVNGEKDKKNQDLYKEYFLAAERIPMTYIAAAGSLSNGERVFPLFI